MGDDDRKTGSGPDEGAETPASPGETPAGTGQRMDLPKWNRARVKRKTAQDREQDAFQGSVRQAGRSAVRRAPWIIGAAAVLAAGLGGGIYLHRQQEQEAAEATRLLGTAAAYRARGQVGTPEALGLSADRTPPIPLAESEQALAAKVDTALADLQEVEPDSAANHLADLIRGSRALEAGDAAAAAEAYRAYLDSAEQDELTFMAREGLGIALEAQQKLQEALEVYETLAGAQGDFYRDMALYHQGRVLEAMDERDQALKVYRSYLEEYPLSEPSLARDEVRSRLAELDPEAIAPAPGKAAPSKAAPGIPASPGDDTPANAPGEQKAP